MVSAAYVGSENGRLDYEGNANAANQASPNNTCAKTDTACNNAYIAAIDSLRIMPWATAGITYAQSIGYSDYHALEAKMQRRFANGLVSLLSYTFGKSTDTSSGYFNVENGPQGGSSVQNYFDLNSAHGVSGYDITHFVSWATVYELPAGRGKRRLRGGPLSWILGNWQANYIFQARSGQPYGLVVQGDVANLKGSGGIGSNGPSDYARPNLIADPFTPGPVPANPNPRCQTTISQGGWPRIRPALCGLGSIPAPLWLRQELLEIWGEIRIEDLPCTTWISRCSRAFPWARRDGTSSFALKPSTFSTSRIWRRRELEARTPYALETRVWERLQT